MTKELAGGVSCETSYGASIEKANRLHRRGERQYHCQVCLLWIWPSDEHEHADEGRNQ